MRRFIPLVALCGSILAAASRSPDQILQDAIRSQQSGDLLSAIRDYQAFLDLKPDVARARSNLGSALAAIGHYRESIAEYQRALQLDPANHDISLNLALVYYKGGQLPNAALELGKLNADDPGNKRVILLLADCYLRTGDNQQVINLLAPVEKDNENDTAVNYLLGTAFILSNDIARGQVRIERIVRNGDSAEARVLMGTMKYQSGDYGGAVMDFKRAVDLNADLAQLHSYYGLALLAVGDVRGAAAAFERELAADPNDFEANLQLGALAKQDQNYDKALIYLEQAHLVRPAAYGPRYHIAGVHLAIENFEEALKELEALAVEVPNVVEVHVTLAGVYYRLKRKEDGDRERSIVEQLNAEGQARQPAPRPLRQPPNKPQ